MIFCISAGALREPLPGRPHRDAASRRKAPPQSAARRRKTPCRKSPLTGVSASHPETPKTSSNPPQTKAAVKRDTERHAGLQISVLVQNIASHADGPPPHTGTQLQCRGALGRDPAVRPRDARTPASPGTAGAPGSAPKETHGQAAAATGHPKNSDAGARHQHKSRSASIQHPAGLKIKARTSPTHSQGGSPGLHLKRGRAEETGFVHWPLLFLHF